MKDKIKLTATLIPLNQKNLNGRIYENNENLRECIKEFNERQQSLKVAYGELGYPDTFDTNLGRISHSIENVRIEDDRVVGDIKVLDTPKGKELKKLLREGVNMVIRPRSSGTVNGDGTVNIKKIFSFDAITEREDAFGKEREPNRIYSDIDPYGEEDWED